MTAHSPEDFMSFWEVLSSVLNNLPAKGSLQILCLSPGMDSFCSHPIVVRFSAVSLKRLDPANICALKMFFAASLNE